MNEQLSELIRNYKASDYAHELVAKYPSLNFAGPTGAGKGTLVTYLTQSGDYAPVVSDTTRTPRPHNDGFEVNGVNYWFLSEEDAIRKLQDDAFIEVKAVHQKTMYGTTIASYERVVKAGRTPILEIDVQGMEDLMGYFPEFEAIFLLPPDFDTWQARLDGRGHMASDDKLRRLASSVIEITTLLNNPRFYPVINNEVVETAELISSEAYKTDDYRQSSLQVARAILEHTQQFLAENN
jgi:guanylate kinase